MTLDSTVHFCHIVHMRHSFLRGGDGAVHATPARRPLARLLATVVVAVLVATLGVLADPATSAADAAPRTSLTVTGTSSMRLGKTATLKISWRKAAKKPTGTVRLQAYTKGAWRTVKNVKVKNGSATVKVKPTTSTSYRAVVGSQRSAKKRVIVHKAWASFSFTKDLDTTISAGSTARGSISLYKNLTLRSGTVTVQRKSGSAWVTDQVVTVPKSGKATFTVAPTATTSYRLLWGKVTSYARKVTVRQDWASLTLSPTTVTGSATTTTATVRWYAKGLPATGTAVLERKSGTTWTAAADIPVAEGTGTLAFAPGTSGTYRVRIPRATSPAVAVTVKRVAPDSFTVTGAGWGHGLGMSQYGAYAMARSGKSVEDILTHYYTDTAVSTEKLDRAIAVQVLGPDAHYSGAYDQEWSSTSLSVTGGKWRLRDAVGTNLTTGSTKKDITIKVVGTQVEASVGGTVVGKDAVLRLHWENTTYYEPTSTKTALAKVVGAQGTYRHGRLTVRAVKDTDGKYYINVVNDLRLNTEYLYGIAEMPSSWGTLGQAALEAQAVAARNYAATMTSTRSDCRCNLVDDIRDQMFTGWNKENEGTSAQFGKKWKRAVDATVSEGGTHGKVLRYVGDDAAYSGKLVTAYYASSAGAATLNSEDAWSAKVPYIRSVKDPWSVSELSGNPYRSWTARLSQANARAYFGLSDVVTIDVRHYEGGGMKALVATSSTGATSTRSGKADQMRSRLNAVTSGVVRSAFVSSIAADES